MSGISGNPDADQLAAAARARTRAGRRRRHRHQGQAPARRGLDRLEERPDARDGGARPGRPRAGPRGRRPRRPAVRTRRGHRQRLAAGPPPGRGRAHQGAARAAQRRAANRDPRRRAQRRAPHDDRVPAADRATSTRPSATPREARDLDLSRGIIYSAWQRGLLPGLLPGPLGRGARHGDPCPRGMDRRGAAAARRVRHLDRLRRSDPWACAATSGWHEWFEIADELAEGALGNKAGVIVMRADIELHQGEVECAADRFESEISTTWFRSPYLAGARGGVSRAWGARTPTRRSWPPRRTSASTATRMGILLRAKGIRTGDEATLRESLDLFKELDCPYQSARTGWLLGGEERERGEARPSSGLGATLSAGRASASRRLAAATPASRASARRPRGAPR